MLITSHTIVKNEERFIKQSLISVLNFVDRMLVWDTGSTDDTVSIIKSINSAKIEFKQCGPVDRKGLVNLRNEQLKMTKTPWFLILDGDEIWPEVNLKKMIMAIRKAKPQTIALVNKTKNCIRDLYHFLPEEKGKYQIGPLKGHLNIRMIKKLKGLKVEGEYPLEAYTLNGKKIQDLVNRLEFIDTWYLHVTHLKRSRWLHQFRVMDRIKKFKL